MTTKNLTNGDDNFSPDNTYDIINGLDGNDTIDLRFTSIGFQLTAWDFAFTVNGGNGDDTLIAGPGISGGTDTATLNGDAGNDTLVGGENVDTLNGGAGNDTLEGHTNRMNVTTTGPSDILDGGGSANGEVNTMIANYQNFYFNKAGIQPPEADLNHPMAVSIDISTGSGQVEITGAADGLTYLGELFSNIQILNFSGPEGNDVVTGGALNDTIAGNGGDDILKGGGGDDIISDAYDHIDIDGGSGNDTLSLFPNGITGDVVIDASTGSGTLTVGGADFGTFANIEHFNFTGGSGNDTITGETDTFSTQVSTLTGGDGNDIITAGDSTTTINGGNGDDVLTGGAGNDIITGGPGKDTIHAGGGDDNINVDISTDLTAGETYDGGSGNDTLNVQSGSSNPIIHTADFSTVNISGIEHFVFVGPFESTYDFTMSTAQLTGFQSIDDQAFSDLTITLSDNSPITITQRYNFSHLQLADGGQTVDDTAFGAQNSLFDIIGGSGDDNIKINGTAAGGAGNDTMTATSDGTFDGGAGDDILNGGSAGNSLSGGAGNDKLTGGAGNDTLDGGAGNDTLDGAGGVNTLSYADDTSSGVAIDLSKSTASGGDATGDIITFASFANLTGGSGNDTLTGNANDNVIKGSKGFGPAGNDTLTGLAGNDTLTGGTGNDILDGGAGNDTMNGGGGNDTYIYNGEGADVISGGFSAGLNGDVIKLTSTYSTFAQVQAHTTISGNNTVISFSTGNSLTLTNFKTALTADNFAFAVDTTAPTITTIASTPSGVSSKVPLGGSVKIDLTTSEAVTVAGAPTLVLSDGGVATFNSGGDTNATTLEFDYVTKTGQNTTDLKVSSLTLSTSIKDLAGNAIVATMPPTADLKITIDTIAPAVTIGLKSDSGASSTDKITNDATLTGSGDPGATVSFTVDGNLSGSTTTANPSGVWTFGVPLSDGVHTIAASETDAAGNIGTASLSFTEDTTSPAVSSILNNGGTPYGLGEAVVIKFAMGEAITVAGVPTLTLNNGGKATYSVADSNLASGLLGFRYVPTAGQDTSDLVLTSVNLPTGASVKDLAGNDAILANANGTDLDFVIDTTAPTILAVTSTPSGASSKVPLGGSVKIDLTTSEAVTVAGAPTLVLSDGGVATFNSGGDTNATTLEFDYVTKTGQNTTDLKVSSLTLPTSIKDLAGNAIVATMPPTADLKITIDTIAPTVTKVAAAAGVFDAGKTVGITLTMGEVTNVDATNGTPYLTLDDGGHANYVSGSGTTSLVFDYTVGSNENSAALKVTGSNPNGGTITDAAGNTADLSKAVTSLTGVVVDTIAPTVTKVAGSVAANGSINTGVPDTITLTMSEKVTVTGAPVLTLDDGGTAAYVSGSGTTALVFKYTPAGLQNSTDLHVTGVDLSALNSAITDPAGNGADLSGVAADLKISVVTTPVVSSVTSNPTSGHSIPVGGEVVIDLITNEPVTVVGSPTLTLSNGVIAHYVSGSGSTTLEFDYTVGAHDKNGDLKITAVTIPSGGSIKDANNHAIVTTGALVDLGVTVDTVAPVVTEKLQTDTGSLATDKLTSIATLTGTGDANAIVHFNVDGSDILDTTTANGTGAWTYTPTGLAEGSHTIIASETDAAGNTGSAPLTFKLDTTAPTVQGVSSTPASGSEIGLNGTDIIKLNMGEALTVTGAPTLTLSDGETATYLAASSTLASGILAFSYKATANHNTSDLQINPIVLGTGVSVKDLAGNAANFTLTTGQADLGLIIDTTAPTITTVASTTVPNTKVPLGGNIVIDLTTSEAVSVAGAPTLTLSDGGVATYDSVNSDPGHDKLEFDYVTKTGQNTTDLKVSSLTLPTSIKDLAGNPIVATLPASADLKIAVDTNLPTVSTIAATPVSPATSTLKSGDVLAIKVTFTDATPGDTLTVTGTPALKLSDGSEATFASQLGDVLTFTYTVVNESTTDLKVTGFDFTNGTIVDSATNAPVTAITVSTADLKDTVNVFTWGKAVSGDWNNNPTDWTPSGVPGAGNTALITATGTPYTVTSGQANSVAVLTMGTAATLAINASTFDVTSGTGAGALAGKINVGDGTTLGLGAGSTSTTFNNTGTIGLNSTGDSTNLEILGNVTLSGTGKLTLTDNQNNAIVSNGSAATLTNGNATAGNTISGAGTIGDANLALINGAKGIIIGNGVNNALFINSLTNAGTVEGTTAQGVTLIGGTSNSGLLEALGTGTANATLALNGIHVTNTTTGVIQASGAGAHVDIDLSNITGGTLKTVGAGAVIDTLGTAGSSTLDGSGTGNPVNNTGNLVVTDHTTLVLKGTINNTTTGTITLKSTGDATNLEASGSVTLQGGGKVILTDNQNNAIVGNGAAATLTNADNTISGAGTIGDNSFTLVNQLKGTINGNATNQLIIDSAIVTNAGTIEATGAGGLAFGSDTNLITNTNMIEAVATGATVVTLRAGNTINNTGGTLFASGTNAAVLLDSASVTGGTFKTTGTNAAINLENNVTLTGVTNTGVINAIAGSTHLTLGGATFNNTTTGVVNLFANAQLIIGNDLTLSGGGKVNLDATTAAIVSDGTDDATLTNGSASTGSTISGFGTIGDSHLLLTNAAKGVITANDAANPLFIDAANVTNAGMIQATNAGIYFSTNAITNSGGTIQAVGTGTTTASVTIAGGNINGGTFFANGTNAEIDVSGGTFTGGTFKTTGTNAAVNFQFTGAATNLNGVTNTGTMNVLDSAQVTLGGGTFNNTGVVNVASNADLIVGSNLTMSGGGKVNLDAATAAIVSDGTHDATLTNADNTIAGIGTIGDSHLSFINSLKGIINANDAAGGVLDINTHSFTNSGLVEATGHGVLDISGNITDTTTGLLKAAAAGAHIDLDNATITSGTVSTVAGSSLDSTSGSSTISTTNVVTNAGRLGAEGGDLTVTGGVNNTGSLDANGSHLTIEGGVTGTGTGTIEGAGTLEFDGAASANVTFAAGATGSLIVNAAASTANRFTGTISGFAGAPTGMNDAFDNFFAFGDSTIDSGWFPTAIANNQSSSPNNETGSNGKNTLIIKAVSLDGNGDPVGMGLDNAQVLARNFGFTILPANDPSGTGTNYAISGAVTDRDAGGTVENTPAGGNTADPGNGSIGNLNKNGTLPSTDEQIANYITAHGGVADSAGVYLIGTGGNDTTWASESTGGLSADTKAQKQAYLIHQADALAAEIGVLQADGAQTILVHDLSGDDPTANGGLGNFATLFDTELFSKLTVAGVTFVESDLAKLVTAVKANYASYGLTATTTAIGTWQTPQTSSAFIDLETTVKTGWGQWGAPTGTPSTLYAYLRAPNSEYTSLYSDDQHFSTQGQQIEADYDLGLLFAAGAVKMDSIDLKDIGYTLGTTLATFSGTATGGSLKVTDGTHTTTLTMSGDYRAVDFVTVSDGSGGASVIEASVNPADSALISGSALMSAHYGGAITAGMSFAAIDYTLTKAVTLTGDVGGLVTLTAAENIVSNGTAVTLTNNETIHGGGVIGDAFMTLTNGTTGIINADDTSNGMLIQTTGHAVNNAGTIEATNGGWLDISHTTITGSSTAHVTASGTGLLGSTTIASHIDLDTAIINGGSVTIGAGAFIDADNGSSNTIAAPVADSGVISVAAGSSLNITGTLTGAGAATIGSSITGLTGGTIEFGAASSANVSFLDATGKLMLDNATSATSLFSGTITGFVHGDDVDLGAINITGSSVSAGAFTGGSTTVTVSDGTHHIDLTFVGDYSANPFQLQNDGHGHVDLLHM